MEMKVFSATARAIVSLLLLLWLWNRGIRGMSYMDIRSVAEM